MPTQQRARGDQTRAARGAWQLARRRREQGTVRGAKLRPRDLATEDLELVAQDEQLEVLDVQATATANERAQKGPEREVEKREGHGRRSSQPSRRRGATRLMAPLTSAATISRLVKQGRVRRLDEGGYALVETPAGAAQIGAAAATTDAAPVVSDTPGAPATADTETPR